MKAENKNAIFQLLVLSILLSKRISHVLAVRAMRGLISQGLTSALNVSQFPRGRIVKILNQNGYARYDEQTATFLQHDAWVVLTRFKGDADNLIKTAKKSIATLVEKVQSFKGIGPVGAKIFMCEAQVRYKWLHGCTTPKAIRVAESEGLDLNSMTSEMSSLEIARLMAMLARRSFIRKRQ